MDQVIAILRTPVAHRTPKDPYVVSDTPTTSQGKWLAVCLAYHFGTVGDRRLPMGAALYEYAGMSARQGPKAYKDLLRCRWIVESRFEPPVVSIQDRPVHLSAIQQLFECNEVGDSWLKDEFELFLKPDNRLLLMVLFSLASIEGRVGEVSDRELADLTGFSPDKLKCQIQRLKHLGFVSGTVPGVTCLEGLGVAKSYVYLNLLHPWWQGLYREWRMIPLRTFVWKPILRASLALFRGSMRSAQPADLADVPADRAYAQQVERYMLNFVFVEVSRMLMGQSSEKSLLVRQGKWSKEISKNLNEVLEAVLSCLREFLKAKEATNLNPNTVLALIPPFGSNPLIVDREKSPTLLH